MSDKCPVCQSKITNTVLGEVCSNDDCGYIDGWNFGPRKKNVINDIEWRALDDKSLQLLKKNPKNMILVQTDITYRIDYAEYIQHEQLVTSKEKVIRFAFIN